MRRALLASFALGSLLFTTTASAQNQGFALDRFEPSERGSEWFAQDTLDLRGNVRPAVGVVGSWAYKPLVIHRADGEELTPLVRHQLVLHPGASIVVADRFRFAFNLPIAAYQDGEPGTVRFDETSAPVAFTPADKAAIGDLRLGADVRLLGRYGEAFTLAFGAQVHLPTGNRDQYMSDGKVRVTPRLQAAGDIGMFAYALRLGAIYRSSEAFASSHVGTELTFGASAGVRALDRKLLIGPELYGSTVLVEGETFDRKATPLEAILGLHYTVGDFRIGAGAGPGLTRGFGSPIVRALLSLEWAPAYEEAKKVEPPPPPPPAPKDSDNDGITDDKDACPTVAGVADPDPKKNGCPSDKDGDGIVDDKDACPEVKGVASEDPKKNGCPPDKDGDGIADDKDACPDVAGVASDDPKKNGCPPDKDGDSVIDSEDACPDTPGPKNADPKKNGCPAVAIVESQIKILDQVKFKTNSAEILKESDDILEGVAKILKDHPELKKIRVEGHTDNKGGKAHNKDLSKRRAAAVVTWLVKKAGLDAKRFESQGFGEEKPIDTNDTDAGRQNNRRVEFHIVDDKGGTSTKVEEKPTMKAEPKKAEPKKAEPKKAEEKKK